MSTTLTIDSTAVTLSEYNAWPTRLSLRFGAISTLTIVRTGGVLPGLPDPWLGKPVVLAISGTTYFTGDVTDADPVYTGKGWVTTYQCRDLRFRGDRIPYTDSNTLIDSGAWNLQSDDRNWIASRAGRTVGEILTDALTMTANATALDAHGIGGYTSLSPPTLPTSTVADLAAMTVIPPMPAYIQGEKLLSALGSFLSNNAPNHLMWIEQDTGALRFSDITSDVTNHTFTLGTDPVEPTPLSRSVSECYQKVIVRGQPIAEPVILSLASGGLEEDFAWGPYATSAAAKAAWTPNDNSQDVAARSQGTCSCTDTLNVVLTSDPTTQTWAANDWDQSHNLGELYLWYEAGAGLDQFTSRRVVSNAAKTSGGTSNFVLDRALDATNYDHYILYGIISDASLVYRKYKVVDPDTAAAMARLFSYGVIWVSANKNVAVRTSAPMGSACWSSTGSPPFEERTIPITFDPSDGTILFGKPTYEAIGNHDPSDVRVLIAVNKGELTAVKPASGYEGTSYSIEGLEETLTITVPSWRDPINQSAMEDYAQMMLDSVKNTIVEGQITYRGLFTGALTFGTGVSVTGSSYTTGWESLNIPIRAVDLEWHSDSPWNYTTTMHVSNRMAQYSSSQFLKPDRPIDGGMIGIPGFEGSPGIDYGGDTMSNANDQTGGANDPTQGVSDTPLNASETMVNANDQMDGFKP